MAERDDGALERAEVFFKKVLGRIGASVDEKLAPDRTRFSARDIGTLAAAIEKELESAVRVDHRGVRKIAPDRFAVLLTYEDDAKLSDAARKALAGELAATAYEYIANHRYETLGRVYVEVGCDLFTRAPKVEASFSAPAGETDSGVVRDVRPIAAGEVRGAKSSANEYQLVGPGGKPVVRIVLEPGGEQLTVGRAAGNRLLVDHDSVSKFHATVARTRDDRLVVADLDSTNGTFVKGEALRIDGAREVSSGDSISFGDVVYVIQKL